MISERERTSLTTRTRLARRSNGYRMTYQATMPSTHTISPTEPTDMFTLFHRCLFCDLNRHEPCSRCMRPCRLRAAQKQRFSQNLTRRPGVPDRIRPSVHLSKLGDELLRPEPDAGGLVPHGARDVPNEGIAVVERACQKWELA